MNRSRRNVSLAPLNLIEPKLPCFLPYWDRELFNFIGSIPLLLKLSAPLRRESMDLAHPQLADIDNTKCLDYESKTIRAADDIRFAAQRREFLLQNAREYLLRKNWIFDNRRALPRTLADLLKRTIRGNHISHTFSMRFLVFYEWLSKYFPDGLSGGC